DVDLIVVPKAVAVRVRDRRIEVQRREQVLALPRRGHVQVQFLGDVRNPAPRAVDEDRDVETGRTLVPSTPA
ncbi:hypothetical protein ACFOUR_10420, partial [Halovivax cerinus]